MYNESVTQELSLSSCKLSSQQQQLHFSQHTITVLRNESNDLKRELAFVKSNLNIERKRVIQQDLEVVRRKSQLIESNALIVKLRDELEREMSTCNSMSTQYEQQLCKLTNEHANNEDAIVMLTMKLAMKKRQVCQLVEEMRIYRNSMENKVAKLCLELQTVVDQHRRQLEVSQQQTSVTHCRMDSAQIPMKHRSNRWWVTLFKSLFRIKTFTTTQS